MVSPRVITSFQCVDNVVWYASLKKNETRSEIVKLTVSTNTVYRLNTGIHFWDEERDPTTNLYKVSFIFADGCVGFLFISNNSPQDNEGKKNN